MNTRVPLDVIDVRTPCPADWDEMAGDDRSRFCAGCGLHVHNLSAMTRTEAERLVCEAAGRLCVRFERTAAGTVATLEYAEPPSRRRGWRFWSALGVVGALAGTVAAALVGRPRPTNNVTLGSALMGDMALPTPAITAPEPAGPPSPDAAAQDAGWTMGETHLTVGVPAGPLGPPAPDSAD